MRAVVTRVKSASVTIGGEVRGSIGKGFLVLLGVSTDDAEAQADKVADKICGLRVFEDEAGKMNVNPADAGAELLIVSQFTLYADVKVPPPGLHPRREARDRRAALRARHRRVPRARLQGGDGRVRRGDARRERERRPRDHTYRHRGAVKREEEAYAHKNPARRPPGDQLLRRHRREYARVRRHRPRRGEQHHPRLPRGQPAQVPRRHAHARALRPHRRARRRARGDGRRALRKREGGRRRRCRASAASTRPRARASTPRATTVRSARSSFSVMETPGHTPGGVTLVCGDALFSGDTLFRLSCGRTDFPGGDMKEELRSLKTHSRPPRRLRRLPRPRHGHPPFHRARAQPLHAPRHREALMANAIDYLDWRGDVPLSLDGFNEVDGLIICKLTSLDFTGIVPEDGRAGLRRRAGRLFQALRRGGQAPGRAAAAGHGHHGEEAAGLPPLRRARHKRLHKPRRRRQRRAVLRPHGPPARRHAVRRLPRHGRHHRRLARGLQHERAGRRAGAAGRRGLPHARGLGASTGPCASAATPRAATSPYTRP